MTTSNKIVFFGNERLATGVSTNLATLLNLKKNGYEIKAIISKNNTGKSSRKYRELEVERFASENNIPFHMPTKIIDLKEEIEAMGAEIGILVAYGKIVPASVFNIFPHGIINIHPSLLPKGRGPTPIESAILNGLSETGVSIMQLAEAMDAGPVYAQQKISIDNKKITKQELALELLGAGSDLVVKILPGILNNEITPKPQNEKEASYNQLIYKTDGKIAWNKPAAEIDREIRAYASWPKSSAKLGNIEVIVTKARVNPSEPSQLEGKISVENEEIVVTTKKDLLIIERLMPINKKEMPVKDFLRGYGTLLNV